MPELLSKFLDGLWEKSRCISQGPTKQRAETEQHTLVSN